MEEGELRWPGEGLAEPARRPERDNAFLSTTTTIQRSSKRLPIRYSSTLL